MENGKQYFKIQEEDMIVEDVPLKMRVIPIEDKMTRSYQRHLSLPLRHKDLLFNTKLIQVKVQEK